MIDGRSADCLIAPFNWRLGHGRIEGLTNLDWLIGDRQSSIVIRKIPQSPLPQASIEWRNAAILNRQ
jgi:hypothetical protein